MLLVFLSSYMPNIYTPPLYFQLLHNPFSIVLLSAHPLLTTHTLLNRGIVKQRLSPRYATANLEPGIWTQTLTQVNFEYKGRTDCFKVCMYVCNQNLFRQRPLKSLLGGPSGLF